MIFDVDSRFLARGVINAWNSLQQSTNFSSLAAFKRSILQNTFLYDAEDSASLLIIFLTRLNI